MPKRARARRSIPKEQRECAHSRPIEQGASNGDGPPRQIEGIDDCERFAVEGGRCLAQAAIQGFRIPERMSHEPPTRAALKPDGPKQTYFADLRPVELAPKTSNVTLDK